MTLKPILDLPTQTHIVKTAIYSLLILFLVLGNNTVRAQKDTTKVKPGLREALGKGLKTNSATGEKDTIWHPKGPGVAAGPGNGGGNVQKTGEGKIEIHAEAKIDSLEHKHRKAKLKGYRIQVFLGSYAQCRDERAKYQKSGILFPSYQVQNAPDYAVRVGDFRNIVEAMTALKDIKRNYPGAFIIPDDIEPPKLGE